MALFGFKFPRPQGHDDWAVSIINTASGRRVTWWV